MFITFVGLDMEMLKDSLKQLKMTSISIQQTSDFHLEITHKKLKTLPV